MTKTRFFYIVSMLFAAIGLCARPARPVVRTVTNSDGSSFNILLRGDESFHFYTTEDGTPVLRDVNGNYRLAPQAADSIAYVWEARRRQRNAIQEARTKKVIRKRIWGEPSSYVGEKKGIVILVSFPDDPFLEQHNSDVFHDMFNKKGYNKNGFQGSVHDYFYDQSYGQFSLTFDIYGPIKASHQRSYYGRNTSQGDDRRVATLAAEACLQANNLYDINWDAYDWDSDGEVDQVYIIFAGHGEEEGASSDAIWSHMWTLDEGMEYDDGNGAIVLERKRINTYAMSCELSSNKGTELNGIGSACHEFSHCLGLPDFYDTSYDGGFGMNAWDLMASGSYNGAKSKGECPAGYTAYERWLAGWLEFTPLLHPTTIQDMPALQDTAVAYIIRNEGNPNEYFVLENRQAQGWFKYVNTYSSCHGLLVYHVDYDAQAWEENTPNNMAEHQRMSIIPASGKYGTLHGTRDNRYYHVTENQYRAHLFPGSQNIHELTDTSHAHCGAQLFHFNTDGTRHMGKPITDISEHDGRISFNFMGGAAQAIISPHVNSQEGTSAPSYYTLSGIPVATPKQSGIYLKKQGESTQKIFFAP